MPRSPSGARVALDAGVLDRQLRLADVEGADGDAAAGGARRSGGGRTAYCASSASAPCPPLGEQELRSEQADAFGAPLQRPRRVVRGFDVGFEPDRDAVLR